MRVRSVSGDAQARHSWGLDLMRSLSLSVRFRGCRAQKDYWRKMPRPLRDRKDPYVHGSEGGGGPFPLSNVCVTLTGLGDFGHIRNRSTPSEKQFRMGSVPSKFPFGRNMTGGEQGIFPRYIQPQMAGTVTRKHVRTLGGYGGTWKRGHRFIPCASSLTVWQKRCCTLPCRHPFEGKGLGQRSSTNPQRERWRGVGGVETTNPESPLDAVGDRCMLARSECVGARRLAPPDLGADRGYLR